MRAGVERRIESPSGDADSKVLEAGEMYDYHWYGSEAEAIKNFETKRFKYGPDTQKKKKKKKKKYYYRK